VAGRIKSGQSSVKPGLFVRFRLGSGGKQHRFDLFDADHFTAEWPGPLRAQRLCPNNPLPGRYASPAGGWRFVLARRQIGFLALALAGGFTLISAPGQALAEGRLEAHYVASLAGIPIGQGNWVVSIGEAHYSAAASGVTTGLMRVFTRGEGTTATSGTISGGRLIASVYAATIKSRRKTDRVRLTLSNGNVKKAKIEPKPDKDPERVPVTDAHRRGVLDPMTASMVRVPGNGDLLVPEACHRTMAIFDGRLRYNLKLTYKRMEQVKAAKGYAGPVVVCSVYFTPIAGYIPSRRTIKYLEKMRDMEVWLAPIAGTRILVPFRAQGPTPIGLAKLEAQQFVSVAGSTRASADGKAR
jgi:hypothetical protein